MRIRSRVVVRMFLTMLCIFTLSVSSAGAGATGVAMTAIPYLDSGYRYAVVDHGAGGTTFADPAFDDSGWASGFAGFGTEYSGCELTSAAFIGTPWPLNSDVLVRKHFTLPAGANGLVIGVAVDNDAQVFVNGVDVSGGLVSHEGCAEHDSLLIPVADGVLKAGDNVIAVRGVDRGTADYLDLQVTYDAPTYQIRPLYDVTKAHKSGSTVPVKIQVLDGNGNNVSSPDIIVHATGVELANGTTSGPLNDSGAANSPGMNFRNDPTAGGYIFNLSTKGLAPGTWKLTFTVGGESQTSYFAQFVVR